MGVRRNRPALRVAALCVGLLLGAVLCEAGIRIYLAYLFRGQLKNLSKEVPTDPNAAVSLGDMIYPVENNSLIYRLKPGARGIFRGAPIEINSLGFRGEEVAVEKPPSTLRIVNMGDSNSFGWGVAVKDAYLTLLQSSLQNLAGGARKIEIINTAAPGYNAVMEVEMFHEEGLKFRPDLVLIQYSYNDHTLPSFISDRPYYKRFDRIYLFRLPQLLNGTLFTGERDAAGLHAPKTPYVWHEDAPGEMDPKDVPAIYRHHIGNEAVRGAYRRLRDTCAREKIPLFIVVPAELVFEWYPEQPNDPHYDEIRKIAAELEIPIIDTFARTKKFVIEHRLRATDLTVNGDLDWHPNPLRHNLMAQVILPVVARALAGLEVDQASVDEEVSRLRETNEENLKSRRAEK